MPDPTASPTVASTVGLKNVVIAPLTADTESAHTYGTLQAVAGAIEASVTPENADPDIQYADDVEFYHLQKPGSSGQLPKVLSAMRHLSGLPGAEQLPASPAVAIWDRAGQLAYFGPYSEGAVCNSSNSFIEPVLDALINNRPVNAANTLAVGCFCDWQQNLDK